MQGTCCSGVLDALGSCCASGALDECGVCDGDGTSCTLRLRLLAQLPAGTNITDAYMPAAEASSSATWQLGLQQLLEVALLKQSNRVQLQVEQIDAAWAPAAVNAAVAQAAQTKISRHLMDDTSAHSNQCELQPSQCLPEPPVVLQTFSNSCQHATSADSSSPCSEETPRDVMGAAASPALPTATARQLLDVAEWRAAYVEVVLPPPQVEAPPESGTVTFGEPLGLSTAALGSALIAGIESQAASVTSRVAGSSVPTNIQANSGLQSLRLLQVLLVERAGVCGNGICEVGERVLLTADNGTLHEATSPCPQVTKQHWIRHIAT